MKTSRALFAVTGAVIAAVLTLPHLFQRTPLLTLETNGNGDSPRTAVTNPVGVRAELWVTLSPCCPVSNAVLPTLNRLVEQYSGRGLRVVGLIPETSAAGMRADTYAERYGLQFEVRVDKANQKCLQLQATHTPQAILTDADGRIIYSGLIDDRFVRIAAASRQIRQPFVRQAIDEWLTGRPVTVPTTNPVGCLIEGMPQSHHSAASEQLLSERVSADANAASTVSKGRPLTFAEDAAAIIYRRCTGCHRPDEAAPFALMTLDDVRQHARQIDVVLRDGLMPPWKPVAGYGRFRQSHAMPAREVQTLRRWISGGCRAGDLRTLPPVPEFTDGWQLGPPDVELVMDEAFDVPADGPDIYQHFVLPTGIGENRLIRAIEFRPGAAEVVHHAFVYFDTTGQARRLDAETPEPGYQRLGTPGFAVSGSLGGWGPGGLPRPLPDGMGRPLPALADLVLQIHYHPSGRRVSDRSRVGLYFARPGTRQMVTEIMVADVDLEIPAGAADHHHHAEWTLPVETLLLDATPHMHTLGRRIRARAVKPDNTIVPLIQINDWDFYWQDTYVFEHPVALPKGTRLELDCWYDNSDANPLNPHSPPQTVFWGDYSDDEMGICYFRATTRRFRDYELLQTTAVKDFQKLWQRYQAAQSSRAAKKTNALP